jgi:hypothetical protein
LGVCAITSPMAIGEKRFSNGVVGMGFRQHPRAHLVWPSLVLVMLLILIPDHTWRVGLGVVGMPYLVSLARKLNSPPRNETERADEMLWHLGFALHLAQGEREKQLLLDAAEAQLTEN